MDEIIYQYTFEGCYSDSQTDTLDIKISDKFTFEMCVEAANASLKYNFFGMRDRKECFVGSNLTNNKLADNSTCNHTCLYGADK